jgi:xanthosine utilization system XapX-like protein
MTNLAPPTNGKATESSLHVHYVQLNERARWYGRQVWYVSLAYLAGGLAAIFELLKMNVLASWALGLIGIIGIFVEWHLRRLVNTWARNVDILIRVEDKLALEKSLPTKIRGHYFPLLFMIRISVAAVLLLALLSLFHLIPADFIQNRTSN